MFCALVGHGMFLALESDINFQVQNFLHTFPIFLSVKASLSNCLGLLFTIKKASS